MTSTLALYETLLENRAADGAWPYAPGRRSRIEPTCWAVLAFARCGVLSRGPGLLTDWARSSRDPRWLADLPTAPPNMAFNALASVAMMQDSLTIGSGRTLLKDLLSVRGVRARQSPNFRQDNALQGWSWIDNTFSWVEPTAWCLFAAKKYRHLLQQPEANDRIQVGSHLLIDRVCASGGWNYGNSHVLGQDLPAHTWTTALGLIAMQDEQEHPAVARSLKYLEDHALKERSAPSLALTAIALRIHDRPNDAPLAALDDLVSDGGIRLAESGNILGLAMALYALAASDTPPVAFML